MTLEELPFKIGMEYENWEFDLEPVILDITIPYEKYRYIKGDITELYGLKITEIYLYFKLDILTKVQYFFNGNVVDDISDCFGSDLNKKITVQNVAYLDINISYSKEENQSIFEYGFV